MAIPGGSAALPVIDIAPLAGGAPSAAWHVAEQIQTSPRSPVMAAISSAGIARAELVHR
ncbi:MAG TPA: hypothetical protein VF070_06330 [Streptosporangiaceae bacterium]